MQSICVWFIKILFLGDWTFRPSIDVDKEELEHDITKKLNKDVTVDDDADFDETDDSELSDDSLNVKQVWCFLCYVL